ncbi:HBL/NHE enterotoxin family protein [Streptomyces noursei]|uniref:HBL/NHE enterotoxin family protein n=1 Tax=Streptomyces noursei TaxID=1971 RepID=UPI0035E1434E
MTSAIISDVTKAAQAVRDIRIDADDISSAVAAHLVTAQQHAETWLTTTQCQIKESLHNTQKFIRIYLSRTAPQLRDAYTGVERGDDDARSFFGHALQDAMMSFEQLQRELSRSTKSTNAIFNSLSSDASKFVGDLAEVRAQANASLELLTELRQKISSLVDIIGLVEETRKYPFYPALIDLDGAKKHLAELTKESERSYKLASAFAALSNCLAQLVESVGLAVATLTALSNAMKDVSGRAGNVLSAISDTSLCLKGFVVAQLTLIEREFEGLARQLNALLDES